MAGKKIKYFIILFSALSALALLGFTYSRTSTREGVARDYIDLGEVDAHYYGYFELESGPIDPQEKENAFKTAMAEAVCSDLKHYANVADVVVDTDASPILVTIMTSDALTQAQKEHIEEYAFAVYPESEIEYQDVTG